MHSILGNRNNLILAENIRTLYLQGKSYEYICQTLGVSKSTINTHRKRAAKEGDDWDTLLLLNRRNTQNIAMSEAYFVGRLIDGFEAQLLHTPELSLKELAKYTKLYFQLKSPKNTDDLRAKEQQHANTMRTIKEIAHLALECNNRAVVEFLSAHADAIVKAVFKTQK
ncbi:hypothetical protein NHP190003_13370 [Helicobacter sp. NHP19-003]|uniref:Uncharacterized protein n=1 Tax=Helicobacter gastrocanis TaxID=2849641 RepID=A0ABM7SEL1_9HELI|nr:DUF1804 family protein [Helicobacter sp. NHP19-003]BCZ18055.1 hypothetical protein NHP190003_13370 [Helicobacter sp. NHP19-003]